MSNSIDLNLLEANKTLEFSSADDADLLNLICYATHEGVNLNGTEFTRQILFECYKSFEDKPLVVVPKLAWVCSWVLISLSFDLNFAITLE